MALEDPKTVGTTPGLTSWLKGFEPALHSLYTIYLYATGLGRPDHRSSRDEDPMRGSRYSTLGRTAGLFIVLFLTALIASVHPSPGNGLTLESLTLSVTVIGNATADGTGLFFEPNEIVVSPPPVLVNVTFINIDFVAASNVQHNFTLIVNGTFFTTPLLDPGETGFVEFWLNETGEYPFFCAVPGHRGLGMEGVFIVGLTLGETVGPAGPQGVELRAYWIGLIGIFSMIAVIIVAYFALKSESRHHTDHREHRRRGLP